MSTPLTRYFVLLKSQIRRVLNSFFISDSTQVHKTDKGHEGWRHIELPEHLQVSKENIDRWQRCEENFQNHFRVPVKLKLSNIKEKCGKVWIPWTKQNIDS